MTAVMDRQFKGEIAATMDKLTTRALQAQVEAAVSYSHLSNNARLTRALERGSRE
jgi:hypothetical protein